MTTRIQLCRACVRCLGLRPLPRRFFSTSPTSSYPIKGIAPQPPARTKFSGFSSAVVTVRSGNGGNGCIAFELSRIAPGRGIPSGGNGGRGGDIYIIAHGTGDLRGVPDPCGRQRRQWGGKFNSWEEREGYSASSADRDSRLRNHEQTSVRTGRDFHSCPSLGQRTGNGGLAD